MTREDYLQYYIQGSDHYLIPKDVFIELFQEMTNWKDTAKASEKARKEAIDYIENTDCCTWDNTAHEDLLNLLDIDKGE